MKKINNTLKTLFLVFITLFASCTDGSESIVPGGTGQGGSMARFATTGNYLYTVDSRMLHVYNIEDAAQPVKIKDVELGVNIETIFPYQDKLFIGSMNGMYIYDITDPTAPVHLSTYRHVTSCDPVVVQGNLAYVTLRSGNTCQWGSNQLDVIDISDPVNPRMINTFQMQNPFGLGIDGNTLFICEGEIGLKVLDVSDPMNIQYIDSLKNIHAFDVIPSNNNLILTGKTGILQYDYTQPKALELKSRLAVSDCE